MQYEAAKKDFGIGNLALIIAVAGILTFLGVQQKHIRDLSVASHTSKLVIQQPSYLAQGNTVLAANSTNTAAVLGASTYDKDFVNGLDISVQSFNDNSAVSAQVYARQMNILFGSDKVADNSQEHTAKFLSDVKQLAVPSSMVDYQKLLIAYYQLGYLAKADKASSDTPQLTGTVKAQLDLVRTTFDEAYRINLP